jgi:hypothetical protein
MTLRDIENALPPCIRFINDTGGKAGVMVNDTYMGMIYDTDEGLFYNSQNFRDCSNDCIRKNTFLSYFNYELLLSVRYAAIDIYELYRLEPKFGVVYK